MWCTGAPAGNRMPRASEGLACQIRFSTISDPFHFHRARQACPSDLCADGPLPEGPACRVRHSTFIDFRRGLKSRAESGAEAPHSMECGDSSPLFGEGFSLHHLAVRPDGTRVTGQRHPIP